jgi:2-aminoadipate transaminase
MAWTFARRAAAMKSSAIRDLLKVAEQPGVISFAGGLPAAMTFPVPAVRRACERVLHDSSWEALQYARSEGYGPLREWIAADVRRHGIEASPSQVLVTTGSQQGLDLLGKVLVDPGSTVLVESPTYLGALQAFAAMEPRFGAVDADAEGPDPQALRCAVQRDARLFYLQPNFQNPTGRTIGEARRRALVAVAADTGLPLVEDNPYGELWFDEAPPASLASRYPEGTVYLGSFSKELAPGLRVGYMVAPSSLIPKLLQAKQAADLHTPGLNQRLVHEMVRDGFLAEHLPKVRTLYRQRRDAMLRALERSMPRGIRWNRPAGGMFLWLRLPSGVDAGELLDDAVRRGVAFVPGAPFFAGEARLNFMRLSFATATPEQIDAGVAALAEVLCEAMAHHSLTP